jgi:hypothetical protein
MSVSAVDWNISTFVIDGKIGIDGVPPHLGGVLAAFTFWVNATWQNSARSVVCPEHRVAVTYADVENPVAFDRVTTLLARLLARGDR